MSNIDENEFLENIKNIFKEQKKANTFGTRVENYDINKLSVRKQFDEFYKDIDINKFFDIFNKLNIDSYFYTNKAMHYTIIELFLKYFKNHKLKWSEWLNILITIIRKGSDTRLIEKNKKNKFDFYHKYGEDENKDKYKYLIDFFDDQYKSGIEHDLHMLDWYIKQSSIELGTIERRRKQKKENYVQWAKDYFSEQSNLERTKEIKKERAPIYEKYLSDFKNIKDNYKKNDNNIPNEIYEYIDKLKTMKTPKPKKLTEKERNIIKQFHNINNMKVVELKQIAKDNNIKGYSKLRKQELIDYITSVKNTEIYKPKELSLEQQDIINRFMNYNSRNEAYFNRKRRNIKERKELDENPELKKQKEIAHLKWLKETNDFLKKQEQEKENIKSNIQERQIKLSKEDINKFHQEQENIKNELIKNESKIKNEKKGKKEKMNDIIKELRYIYEKIQSLYNSDIVNNNIFTTKRIYDENAGYFFTLHKIPTSIYNEFIYEPQQPLFKHAFHLIDIGTKLSPLFTKFSYAEELINDFNKYKKSSDNEYRDRNAVIKRYNIDGKPSYMGGRKT
jgi:hypothetical protein